MGDQTETVLEVEGLNAFYGASHVLFDISMRVAAGELVALLGRNGAGKTTTFSALVGLVTTRCATLRVGGSDLVGTTTHQRARRGLSLVPSGARVFSNLSVQENLEVVRPGATDNGTGESWDLDKVYGVFPKLADLRASFAGNLSGGERQMLAVGRGLMANPAVMLLDEPSEGLAPVILQDIGRLLGRLREMGLSLMLAEQNHRFALKWADRGYLIEKGQIRHEAPAEELVGSEALQRHLGV